MQRIIIIFLVASAAVLGYWAGGNKSSSGSSVMSPILIDRAHETPSTVASTQEKQEVSCEEIHSRSDDFSDKKIISLEHQKKITMNQSAQKQIDAVKTEYEFEQRSEEFNDWLTKNQENKPWFDLGLEMSARFEAEEINYRWAINEEGQIQTLFTREQELAGIALKSTTCKSTQCQIKIGVTDQNHANEAAMVLSQVLGAESFSQIIVDSQVQQGEAVFYVSRNEKGFEFN